MVGRTIPGGKGMNIPRKTINSFVILMALLSYIMISQVPHITSSLYEPTPEELILYLQKQGYLQEYNLTRRKELLEETRIAYDYIYYCYDAHKEYADYLDRTQDYELIRIKGPASWHRMWANRYREVCDVLSEFEEYLQGSSRKVKTND